MGEQEEVGTELALGIAEEVEGEVVEVAVEEVGVVELGQGVVTPQDLHLETVGPVEGWETAPSVPPSAHCEIQAGSWELEQKGVEGEEEVEEEMLLHWSVKQGVLAVEE